MYSGHRDCDILIKIKMVYTNKMVRALHFHINFLKVEEVREESVERSFCLKKKKDKNVQR